MSLGLIGTTATDAQPNVKCMRCVYKEWCTLCTFEQKIWDDSGSGVREGSMWLFNSLMYVGFVIVSGSDPPRKRPWDMKCRRF